MPIVQSAPTTFQVAVPAQPLVIQSPTQGQLTEDPSPPIVGLAPSGPSDSTTITIRIWNGSTVGTPAAAARTHAVTRSGGLWVWDPVTPDLANGVWTVQVEQGAAASTYGPAVYGVSPYASTSATAPKSSPVTFTVTATDPPHPPTVTIYTPSSGGTVLGDGSATGFAGSRPEDDPTVTVTIYNNVGAVVRTATPTVVSTQWAYTFSPVLPIGSYQIEVVQGSTAGPATSGRRSFTVSPDVVVVPPPTTSPTRRGIRELPPLRLSYEAHSPSGRFYRWGDDEPRPENVAQDVRFSSTMPGGFEAFDCTLPRHPGVDYRDLDRLTTIKALSAGETVWEGRLERAPATSGDEMSVSPSAVGWQAALEDDKSVQFLGFDQDLSSWGGMPAQQQLAVGNIPSQAIDGSVVADSVSGIPGVQLQCESPWLGGRGLPVVEAWYDARGVAIGSLVYAWRKAGVVSGSDPDWWWAAYLTDGVGSPSFDSTGNLRAAGPGSGTLTATASTHKFALLQLLNFSAKPGFEGWQYSVTFQPAVVGDHGIPIRTNIDDSGNLSLGLWASDIIRHVVPKYARGLKVTADSVDQSRFVIEQFAYLDATTCGELVRQATRVGLQDWAVWEDKVFWWLNRGNGGRQWRARSGSAQLSETGPQLDRLWNGVIVSYTDVDGSTRTVGPPGSGATVESVDLVDLDPENPANELGLRRWDLLQMGTGTPAMAAEIGRRFLEEQKLLDTSGSAQFVGHIQDDKGVWFTASAVRAGDTVVFTDAADNSPRRIVKADYDHSSRTCSVDLDSPPLGLEALLSRLGVALQPLGVGA